MIMKLFQNNKKHIIVFLIIILFFIIFQNQTRSLFYRITGPIGNWIWLHGRNASLFISGLWPSNKLIDENRQLKEENIVLFSKLIEIHGLKKENEKLRSAIGLGLNKDYNLIEAKAFSQKSEKNTYLINKGEESGILKGMPIITFQKVLVGRVSEVYKNSSEIRLVTHAGLKFSAKIKDSDVMGLAQGDGENFLKLSLIPKAKEINIGQVLITSGPEGGFPANLLVGKIIDIKKTDLEAFQEATVEPFFNHQDLNYLLIITDIK